MTAMRTATIGGGWVARTVWLPLFEEAGATLASVVDPSADARDAVAARFPGIRVHHALDDAALDGCDLALVCSPNAHHVEHAAFALERGLHVIVDKPACFSLAEAEFLVGLSERRQRGLWVTSASSRRGDVLSLYEHARHGALGAPHCIDVGWRRRAGIPRPGSWFTRAGSALAGSGGDLGWHLLEVGLGLLDYPLVQAGFSHQVMTAGDPAAQLAAWRGDDATAPDAELSVDTQLFGCLLADTGAVVRVSTAWASHREHDETVIHAYGQNGELALRCTFGFSTNGVREPTLTLARDGAVHALACPSEERIAPYRAFVRDALALAGRAAAGERAALSADYRKLRSLGSAMAVLYPAAARAGAGGPATEPARAGEVAA
ncbi:hypothetical protein WK43_29325 [Burkholderia ubonensis]|uniref:Gfo/Idh/MocA-like oxidoreductase N-terminal domain-containing protein n=2 Tax=Burkholderia ubonensis TaxID=101571 RepID=A0A107G0P5_9BURK|nr:hypothetical protein WK37_26765 [Burkholderia ubonensis]KVS45396.1 hypothetical protein WK38_23405 [Burkholderia ubonensis]KVS78155.1 hypothetical protein WK42_16250 [Burkholderia ubonensis]KVS79577.1 hypothetical protein WK43_29325 [Burkholderia ubonensis]KVS87630.1 hypothetical protein WK44_01410 [Burkholderia ubonensis]